MKYLLPTVLALALLAALPAAALDPDRHAGLWAEVSGSGPAHGVLLEYAAGIDQFAVLWFNQNPDTGGQAWFISDGNCLPGEACKTYLFAPTGQWMGGAELGDHVGWIEIEPAGDELLVDWYFTGFEFCQTTPGGAIFRRCTGPALFRQITNPRD